MGSEISWQVELAVKPGELGNLRALTRDMVAFARSESGVLVYERFVSEDGKTVYVYERFVDSASAVAHLTAFGKWFGERFANLVERRWFRVYGTPSDELRGILDPFGVVYLSLFDGFSRFLEASG
jgi:quinol monooxygenase YgiN